MWICVVSIFVASITACQARQPPKLSKRDLAVIEDFRRIDRDARAMVTTLRTDLELELDLDSNRQRALSKTWRDLQLRVENAALEDAALDAALREYAEARGAVISVLWSAPEQGVSSTRMFELVVERWARADAADAELQRVLTKYDLPPLPAVVEPQVALRAAAATAATNAAFLLVDGTVLRVDAAGFHVFATDASWIDASPGGVLWVCGGRTLVRWDGTQRFEYPSKLPVASCAVGTDGALWLFDEEDRGGRLARFDGTTWSIKNTPRSYFGPYTPILVDKDQTAYAKHDSKAYVLRPDGWKVLDLDRAARGAWVQDLVRGNDGHVYAIYQVESAGEHPSAFAQLSATGGKPPLHVDDWYQISRWSAVVDGDGLPTLLDHRRSTIMQGEQRMRLPVPPVRGMGHFAQPFALDGRARIWADLFDGLYVIDARSNTRVVFPHGSIDLVRGPIERVVVIGDGPELPPPGPVHARTFSGIVLDENAAPIANALVETCANPPPCAPKAPRWSTRTDRDGRFTLDLPRWRLILALQREEPEPRLWYLPSACCAGDATDLGRLQVSNQW